jgi:hypothetical protein
MGVLLMDMMRKRRWRFAHQAGKQKPAAASGRLSSSGAFLFVAAGPLRTSGPVPETTVAAPGPVGRTGCRQPIRS